MIENLAHRFSRSTLLRHLFFLGASLLAIGLIGYHFGTFDQNVHIPFLKKEVYPALYPGDPFMSFRAVHYSYFWFLFRPFLRLGILEPVMFVVHVFATYLTFWMLWKLSLTLFEDDLTALISTVIFITPHFGLPGFPLIEFSLLNRTFILPFLLMGIILHLKGRHRLAFLLIGVMFDLHVLSASFVLAMLLFDLLLRWREVGLGTLATSFLLFLLGALPVLIWRFNGHGTNLVLQPHVLDVAARGVLGSIYYMVAPQPEILQNPLNGLGTLALFLIGHFTARSARHDKSLTHFVIAIGIIVLVNVIVVHWLPITLLYQMQILRAARDLVTFGYLYFAAALVKEYRAGTLRGTSFWITLGTTVAMPIAIFPALVWWIRKWFDRAVWRRVLVSGLVGVLVAVLMVGSLKIGLWKPGVYLYGPQGTPWVDVQEWARDNTPQDAVFITPPQIYGFYTPDWRVFSERTPVVTLNELEEVPFMPDYLPGWQERFDALAPGAVDRFDYNFSHSQQYTAEAFYGLSTPDLLDVAAHYGASYLVVEKPHTRDLPVLYENAGYIVYQLPAPQAVQMPAHLPQPG